MEFGVFSNILLLRFTLDYNLSLLDYPYRMPEIAQYCYGESALGVREEGHLNDADNNVCRMTKNLIHFCMIEL